MVTWEGSGGGVKKINKGVLHLCWAILTDSAVWPGKAGSALAPKPVDPIHADAAVVAVRGGGSEKS